MYNSQLFLCPGLAFRLKDGSIMIIEYVWSLAADCTHIDTEGKVHYPKAIATSTLRDSEKATLIGNNFKFLN